MMVGGGTCSAELLLTVVLDVVLFTERSMVVCVGRDSSTISYNHTARVQIKIWQVVLVEHMKEENTFGS